MIVVEHDRQHDDARIGSRAGDAVGRGDPVARHADVEQADIRVVRFRAGDGARGVGRLGHDVEATGEEDLDDRFSRRRVIVGDDDGRPAIAHRCGTSICTVVPQPGVETMRYEAPSRSARSRIEVRPKPAGAFDVRCAGIPSPSSATVSCTHFDSIARRAEIRFGRAVASRVDERLVRDAPHLVRGVRVHDDVVVEVEHDVAAVALLDVAAQLRDHASEPAITLVPVGRDDAARLSERVVGRLMQLGQLLVVVAAVRREAALGADVGEFLGQAVVDLRRDAPALVVARRVRRLGRRQSSATSYSRPASTTHCAMTRSMSPVVTQSSWSDGNKKSWKRAVAISTAPLASQSKTGSPSRRAIRTKPTAAARSSSVPPKRLPSTTGLRTIALPASVPLTAAGRVDTNSSVHATMVAATATTAPAIRRAETRSRSAVGQPRGNAQPDRDDRAPDHAAPERDVVGGRGELADHWQQRLEQ